MVLLLSLFEPVLGNGNLGVDEHVAVNDSTAEILSGNYGCMPKRHRDCISRVLLTPKFVDGASILSWLYEKGFLTGKR